MKRLNVVGFLMLGLGCSYPALAQVTADSTAGTTVSNSSSYTVMGGTQQLDTLFHSFSEFSPGADNVLFELDTATQNGVRWVIGRVTGSNSSLVDGELKLTGGNSPDLFLINPNGITFGANASLSLPGSLIVSTAESVLFDGNLQFSTSETTFPLLTFSTPVGLQMGSRSSAINIQGSGHQLNVRGFTPIDRSSNPTGLQIASGNTLALVGNEINASGGVLTTNFGGHLELGSVSTGKISLDASRGWLGDYSGVSQFGDITLTHQSLLDASGANGSIQLYGRDISLLDGSFAMIQNLGTQPSNGITIQAAESLRVEGTTPNNVLASFVGIDSLGSGAVGDITLSAAHLSLQDGGKIQSQTFSATSGSNIIVNTTGVAEIDGYPAGSPQFPSAVASFSYGNGDTGNIRFTADDLSLTHSGIINSANFGSGGGGEIEVNITDLLAISGVNPIVLTPSAIGSVSVGSGSASDITVNTARLRLSSSGFLGSGTLSSGTAGNVTVNASESINIQGRADNTILPNRIASAAEILDAATQAAYGLPAIPSGDSGNVTINTPFLRIADQGSVTARNDGPGTAGNVEINADAIVLNNAASITAVAASGEGGNIVLQGDALVMRNDSLISATAGGTGNGGNITIGVKAIAGTGNSDIVANAVQGNGGNIDITAQGIFGLLFRDQLTPDSDITASSEFGVNGTVEIKDFDAAPNAGLVELPTNFVNASSQVARSCADTSGNSFVLSGRGGLPQNPAEVIGSDSVWVDLRDFSNTSSVAARSTSRSYSPSDTLLSEVKVTTDTLSLTEATGWQTNIAGQIELTAHHSRGAASIGVTKCHKEQGEA